MSASVPPSPPATIVVPQTLDPDAIALATLLVRVAQHAKWTPKPLVMQRANESAFSHHARVAAVLAERRMVTVVTNGQTLQLSLSTRCQLAIASRVTHRRTAGHELIRAVRLQSMDDSRMALALIGARMQQGGA
jgi:hypothetical protein